jgi:hypothetical protein
MADMRKARALSGLALLPRNGNKTAQGAKDLNARGF